MGQTMLLKSPLVPIKKQSKAPMLHSLIVVLFFVQFTATSGCLPANTATNQHPVTLPHRRHVALLPQQQCQ